MATCEVVGSILLTRYQLLRMEQLAIGTCANLVDHGRFQVNEHTPGNMLACSSLREEGVEGIIPTTNGLVAWHLPIWLNTVLQAEQLPACVSDLDAGLADVDAKRLTHGSCERCSEFEVSVAREQVLADKREQEAEPPRNATDPPV